MLLLLLLLLVLALRLRPSVDCSANNDENGNRRTCE
jgi:hypothetical protein